MRRISPSFTTASLTYPLTGTTDRSGADTARAATRDGRASPALEVRHNLDVSDLEDLLAAAATEPRHVPGFLTGLLDAQVLVPGELLTNPADVNDGSAALVPLSRPDGTSVQPFFTSEARLQETVQAVPGYQPRYVSMRCRDLWEMTRGATLVLNPHSAYGKEFIPSEIAQLLDGSAAMSTHVVPEATQVLVGRPAQVPDGMEDALRELFARTPAVDAAYLGWKVIPDTGDQSYLLVIVGAQAARAAVGDELGRALVVYSQTHPIDAMFAAPGEDHLLATIEPFYLRQPHRRRFLRR